MPRIRTLKPEIWLSAQVMNLSLAARLLFVGLITQADDEGRGASDPRRIKAAIFPGDEVTLEDVRGWLAEVAGQGLAVVYEAEGYGDLYWLPSWSEHQSINKSTPSRYPPPSGELRERYGSTTAGLPGDRKDRIGRKEGSERATGARRAPEARAPGALERPEGPSPAAAAEAIAANQRNLRRALGVSQ